MKSSLRHLATVGVFGIALTLSSCVSPYYGGGYYGGPGPRQQNGTVVGALGGGAVGGIIGNQSGRGLEGALIGAVLGSLAGSTLGASHDQQAYGYNGGYARPVSYGRPYGYGRPYYGSGYGYRPASFTSVSIGSGCGVPFGRGYGSFVSVIHSTVSLS